MMLEHPFAKFWFVKKPQLQNAQAISIAITTVLPDPVAILQPSRRS